MRIKAYIKNDKIEFELSDHLGEKITSTEIKREFGESEAEYKLRALGLDIALPKIRRRIEDRLRKGSAEEIIKTAKALGINRTVNI